MIQVYSENNTNYSQNGDAVLMPTECTISVEIGGKWSMKIAHPVDDGGRWTFLSEEAVIKAPSYNGEQLWRIRKREKDELEVVCDCEPIFFDSMNDCFLVDVRPTNKTGQAALNAMITNAKYSGVSDITKTSTAYYQYKNLMEALQGNDDNAFVNRWGGEFEFDNFTVRAMAQLGADHGVIIRYGKNIGAIKETVDMAEVITRVYPSAYNGRRYSSGYVDSPIINSYPTVKTATKQYSHIYLAEDATESTADDPANIICANQAALDAALRAAVLADYAAGIDKPAVTLDVDMIDLRNTQGYADYKNLETVSLGDVCHLYHSRLGIESTERVIGLEYDAITDSVKKIVLGVKQYDYFNQINGNITNLIQQSQKDQGMAAAIESATGAAHGAASAVSALEDSLGTMAYQTAASYPAAYKGTIFDAVLDAWGDQYFHHRYTVDTNEIAGGAWTNFTTDTPDWAMPIGRYLIVYNINLKSTGTGEATARFWEQGAEMNALDGSSRATAATISTREVAISGAFFWDNYSGTFNGYPQIYGSRAVYAQKASITVIRVGGILT